MKPESQIDWHALALAINARRKERTVTLKAVALESGISKSRLSDLEAHNHPLGREHYARACAWLGVPLERFMLNHQGRVFQQESTPDKVEAALMRDTVITRVHAVALSEMFRTAYRTLATQ